MRDDAWQTRGVSLHFLPLIQYPVSMTRTRQVVIAAVVGVLGAIVLLASAAGGIRLTNPALLLGVLLLADAVLRFMMLPHEDQTH
jgi:hypothetical protein